MIDQNKINFALDALAKNDSDLVSAIKLVGYPEPRIRPKGFATLFSVVVSQQLSTHAARAIMGRANDLFNDNINAKDVLNFKDEQFRQIGLSRQKISYVKGLSEALESKQLNLDALETLDDDAVKKQITQIKGFGPWSAEIYLMFSLQREDIFPSGDLALLLALQRLKKLDHKPTPKEAIQLIKHWSPWRTVGSLFLWHYYKGGSDQVRLF